MPIIKINSTTRISKEGKTAQIQVFENGKWIRKAHRTLDGTEHWPTVQEELINSI
ncbi:hypothetical protein [Dyadobacter sp. CY312]|uniref:hypothetical protein n=1 Tax=Dyadobacter sp. CY312 TaxID=2907303 RepID=UPI001F2FB185|nr:hypothetical protein [Dyadobacter sp. CY312]MCE7039219.1 hypothetical protein [Dyadobacter sp. CY312]